MKQKRLTDTEILERLNLIEKTKYYRDLVLKYLKSDFMYVVVSGKPQHIHKHLDIKVYTPNATLGIYYKDRQIRRNSYDEYSVSLLEQVIDLIKGNYYE